MVIDSITYNKSERIPYNPNKANGYQLRPQGRLDIRSILVHTTNGKVGTTFAQEANYIANSLLISSHYIISKSGIIVEILDPLKYIAYHAGCVKAMAFSNLFAVGIEMHNTPLEGHCTQQQLIALDGLVRELIARFNIKKQYIETHREVAIFCEGHKFAGQKGRKIDPSGFPDNEFYAWRDTLYKQEIFTRYKVVRSSVNIRTSPQVNPHNIVGELTYGDTFESVATKQDELGKFVNGSNLWVHLTRGMHNGKPLDGLGFVHRSNLVQI